TRKRQLRSKGHSLSSTVSTGRLRNETAWIIITQKLRDGWDQSHLYRKTVGGHVRNHVQNWTERERLRREVHSRSGVDDGIANRPLRARIYVLLGEIYTGHNSHQIKTGNLCLTTAQGGHTRRSQQIHPLAGFQSTNHYAKLWIRQDTGD